MSAEDQNETIADKAKEGLSNVASAAKSQIDALKTKEGRDELKNKAKEFAFRAKDYLLALRTKEGRQALVENLKTMTMQQKAVFGATAICLLIVAIGLLRCVFSSSQSDLNRNAGVQPQSPNIIVANDDSPKPTNDEMNAPPPSSRGELTSSQTSVEVPASVPKAGKDAHDTDDFSPPFNIESEAKSIIGGITIWAGPAGNGVQSKWKPSQKVSLDDFVKGYYAIADAFMPHFLDLLNQIPNPLLAKPIQSNVLPRADHLVAYCSETGILDSSSLKDKKLYVAYLQQARQIHEIVLQFMWAFGQDDKSQYNEAKQELASFMTSQKELPPHEIDPTASEKYVAPPIPLDLQHALDELKGKYFYVDQHFRMDWRASEASLHGHTQWTLAQMYEEGIKRSNSNDFKLDDNNKSLKNDEDQYRDRLRNKAFKGIPLRDGFPIDSVCGFKFCHPHYDNTGNIKLPLYCKLNSSYGIQGYLLEKPFRMFKYAEVSYSYPEGDGYGKRELKAEFEALRYVRLDGLITSDINYESALEELTKVKAAIEAKYKIDLGKGNDSHDVYGVGLPGGGWILLALYEPHLEVSTTIKDGTRVMSLEICYGNREDVDKECSRCLGELQAQRTKEAESKKKKLNVSDDAGADVL